MCKKTCEDGQPPLLLGAPSHAVQNPPQAASSSQPVESLWRGVLETIQWPSKNGDADGDDNDYDVQPSESLWTLMREVNEVVKEMPAVSGISTWYFVISFINIWNGKEGFKKAKGLLALKHRKNCECCPGHCLIVNHYCSMSWFNLNRCLCSHWSHCSQCLLVSTSVN